MDPALRHLIFSDFRWAVCIVVIYLLVVLWKAGIRFLDSLENPWSEE